MTAVVLSPHTDDAVFSIGDHLLSLDRSVVVAPMAGIPSDVAGRVKHETLQAEHAKAMAVIGCGYVNGPFLDDVYAPPDPGIFAAWVSMHLADADMVYVPVGIHHVDHVMVSNTAIALMMGSRLPVVRFYGELPYLNRYPGLGRERLDFIRAVLGDLEPVECVATGSKVAAVRAYASQTDDDLIAELVVPEHVWQVS